MPRLPDAEIVGHGRPAEVSKVKIPSRNAQRSWFVWNWKAAVFSAATRAPIFGIAAASHGWHGVIGAVLVEAAYRVCSSGVFAGVTQAMRDWKPIWRPALCLTVVIP